MMPSIKKSLLAAMMMAGVTLTGATGHTAPPDVQDTLPDIGTTAGGTLTIGEEQVMGDYFVRQLRASAPLIYDPTLSEYINRLGHRLVANANSVRTPFHFYLVQNDELNAFAFFGGNVVLHTGLFSFTDNENELASVMAHEISHVTQRHLARAMEEQKRSAPLVWAGAIGSILLAMANPEAGIAALTGTMAGGQQNMISFTQSNEQEADRIGMRLLVNSGFDPNGMPNFMQKLLDQNRYSTRPPEILLTHPLPESRLADARNRAHQFPRRLVASSQDFLLAKVRIMAMYKTMEPTVLQDWLQQLAHGNIREQDAARYGQAVHAYKQKKLDEAANLLQPLLTKAGSNVWYLDLMTDIDIDRKQIDKAISRLETATKKQKKEPVLLLNLANAYLEGHRAADAGKLLNRYTYDYPDDMNGWDLLAKANALQGRRDEELAARAESMALIGNLEQSILLLTQASKQAKLGSLNQARYDARLDQFRQLQKRFGPIAKNSR